MVDKKILKIYIIGLIFGLINMLMPAFIDFGGGYNQYKLYNLPFGNNGSEQALVFYFLVLLAPYLAIFLGYSLSYLIV